jgi:hypothetical protein
MIQSLPSGSRQYVSNHLTTDKAVNDSLDKLPLYCQLGPVQVAARSLHAVIGMTFDTATDTTLQA